MFQLAPNLSLARAIKNCESSCIIVMGGACCEGEMGLTVHEEFPWVDYICRGEGERFIVQLLSHLETGSPAVGDIPGLLARVGTNSVATGESTDRVQDLESLPIPDYSDWADQIQDDQYEHRRDHLWLPIEASRGCWWGQKSHCIFCGLNGENMIFREKSADRVWKEIMACLEFGIKRIYFVNLILPIRFFETLLPRLAKADLGLTIFYEVKSNLTYRQLELLAEAGIRLIQPGIESLSTPILRLMRKGVTGLQNLRLLKWAAELGVDVSWNLLYGFPGEDPAEYARMAALIPLISHLQPPFSGCRRVRVDRFSPLFFDWDRLGVGSLRPTHAYESVYGLPQDRLARLAYFFEPESAAPPESLAREHRKLAGAVEAWICGLAESSFPSLMRGDRILLFDQRPGVSVWAGVRSLSGLEGAVYKACADGATIRSIAETTASAEEEVGRILESFEREGLVTHLDGHYLGLAVRMDRWVPVETPEILLGAVCNAIHRTRMLRLRKPSTIPPTSIARSVPRRRRLDDNRRSNLGGHGLPAPILHFTFSPVRPVEFTPDPAASIVREDDPQ